MFGSISSWWSSTPSASSPTEEKAKYDPTNPAMNPLNPKGLKPCCACPETKSARDACFLQSKTGGDEGECAELVRRHVECMRSLGFQI
ncbi:hypothetical protein SERLA73DRAFT_94574 [Serpula lacrymans var. lacrymans S7.3]|uniref:Uncharacterized protein n=2 Tax=Serpula lacrymans var. lacrymans TaxID=341189 RepID=F8Q700_SERL3|nr:uncharacterized protein SERLADRAFT_474980 [Serpula lacrymans var. lacrymans S7.9]EGN96388.1 hypothetical protein SERLA73DRAFT_94574 [Serpula lacrymans var. lacrymans S7.3]EGO21924.1 hypothetical protein SERLADRAFT_474980 [Serpula lacrymans var. lacrymans S7.9]